MRHIWNFRRKARGRPQSGQRLCWRVENFGLRFACAIFESLAILLYPGALYERKGIPMYLRSARPSSSEVAVVTIVTFIPFTFST